MRVGGLGYAAFGEDGGYVAGGSDVEGGVCGGDVGGDSNALDVGDFVGGALLDRDVVAVGNGKIEGGNRRGDVEGHIVFFGEHGDLIGADFVGGVAVGGNAVSASDDGAHFSGLQEVAHHIVGDEREGNAAAMQLPGGEACALEIGARFRNQDVDFFSLFERHANHAEGRADSARG